jgi:hypothetical protein
VTDHYGLLEEFAEPCCGGFGVDGETEGSWCGAVTIIESGKRDIREIRRVHSPDPMHCGHPCGVDKAAVQGINGPSTIKSKTASRADSCGLDFDRIERFDGMDLNAGQS